MCVLLERQKRIFYSLHNCCNLVYGCYHKSELINQLAIICTILWYSIGSMNSSSVAGPVWLSCANHHHRHNKAENYILAQYQVVVRSLNPRTPSLYKINGKVCGRQWTSPWLHILSDGKLYSDSHYLWHRYHYHFIIFLQCFSIHISMQ